MHILIATDQHADSLGGAQVSIRLQKRFLEQAGHRVSVVAPRMHREHPGASGYIDLPSMPVTIDREYSMSVPGRRSDRALDAALAGLPPVDVVHIQGDFWGAFIGLRYAARHRKPVVLTFHNNMEFGIERTVPFPRLAIRFLLWWQARALGVSRSTLPKNAWRYLNELALRADAATAPSGHFARRLQEKGAASGVEVILTGADDAVIDEVLAARASTPARGDAGRPLFVWMGRMSHEKRLMEFLEAVRLADVDAEFRLYGAGMLLAKAQAFVAKHGLGDRVVFAGKVPYRDALGAIASADALVQTSIGFETQGMTVFEAAALGTPSIISDPDIAGELPDGVYWPTRDGSIEALAELLRRVAADATSGTARIAEPDASAAFRQSHQTARMLAVYERVLADRSA